MSTQVALIGIGHSKISPTTPEYSYKELIHEAARAAYQDAGLNSHRDIDGFVTCAEDLIEGTSIFDEYTPDQLGAVQKPVHTVTGDTLHGLIVATMKIQTGLMDVVAVEAHSKASNIETYEHITHFALDPTWNRPLNVHPYFISGLDMNYYMKISKTTEAQVAAVVSKNKRHALKNELACCSENISTDQVLTSAYAFEPVREAFIAPHIDGAFVFVLASKEKARALSKKPIWISGMGWNSDSPTLETRNWDDCLYAKIAAKKAYKQADITNPKKQIDFFEVDDSFAFKELQHLEALGIYANGQAGKACLRGDLNDDGKTPVNISGGTLGFGSLLEANGSIRVLEIVKQLRGEAGLRQLKKAKTGLAFSWRGIPTTSGAAMVFSTKGAR